VGLSALLPSCVRKLPHGGAIHRQKGRLLQGKAAGLQAAEQSAQSFLNTKLLHRDQGIKQVKTNGCDMLHPRPSFYK
jgi:hypothetical protein